MQSNQPAELLLHEWAAVATVCGFICTLAAVAFLSSPPLIVQQGPAHSLVSDAFEIYVQGCVENPGACQVQKGCTLAEVLLLAKPLPEADLRRLNGGAKVRHHQVIKVPAKKAVRSKAQKKNGRKTPLKVAQE